MIAAFKSSCTNRRDTDPTRRQDQTDPGSDGHRLGQLSSEHFKLRHHVLIFVSPGGFRDSFGEGDEGPHHLLNCGMVGFSNNNRPPLDPDTETLELMYLEGLFVKA